MKHTILIPLALAVGIGACASGGTVRAQRGGDPAAMLANADANRDGRITRSEFTQARGALFDRLDRNGDGYVSSADGPRRRRGGGGSGQRLADLRRALDHNQDGRIDRREFVDAPGRLFERADVNRDGVVDRQELEAIQRTLAERKARS